MNVFIVTAEGVYRHEIVGVFLDENSARARAVDFLQNENDGYHQALVSVACVGAYIDDSTPIATYSQHAAGSHRGKGEIIVAEIVS